MQGRARGGARRARAPQGVGGRDRDGGAREGLKPGGDVVRDSHEETNLGLDDGLRRFAAFCLS